MAAELEKIVQPADSFDTEHIRKNFAESLFHRGARRFEKNPAFAVASLGGYFAALDALSVVAEKKKEVLIETLSK